MVGNYRRLVELVIVGTSDSPHKNRWHFWVFFSNKSSVSKQIVSLVHYTISPSFGLPGGPNPAALEAQEEKVLDDTTRSSRSTVWITTLQLDTPSKGGTTYLPKGSRNVWICTLPMCDHRRLSAVTLCGRLLIHGRYMRFKSSTWAISVFMFSPRGIGTRGSSSRTTGSIGTTSPVSLRLSPACLPLSDIGGAGVPHSVSNRRWVVKGSWRTLGIFGIYMPNNTSFLLIYVFQNLFVYQ